jgi:hypothetical protein
LGNDKCCPNRPLILSWDEYILIITLNYKK